MIAPIVGSTLGGRITDSYAWRWVFLINAPVGLLALAGCYFLLREPDYLITQRAELRKQPFHFDSIGLSLLAIVIVCREVMLSKGQGVGLAGRSVLAHPDARHLLYRGFGGAGPLGDASPQPRGEFSSAGRTQLRGLLHHPRIAADRQRVTVARIAARQSQKAAGAIASGTLSATNRREIDA